MRRRGEELKDGKRGMRREDDCGFRVDLYAYKGMRREEGEVEDGGGG